MTNTNETQNEKEAIIKELWNKRGFTIEEIHKIIKCTMKEIKSIVGINKKFV